MIALCEGEILCGAEIVGNILVKQLAVVGVDHIVYQRGVHGVSVDIGVSLVPCHYDISGVVILEGPCVLCRTGQIHPHEHLHCGLAPGGRTVVGYGGVGVIALFAPRRQRVVAGVGLSRLRVVNGVHRRAFAHQHNFFQPVERIAVNVSVGGHDGKLGLQPAVIVGEAGERRFGGSCRRRSGGDAYVVGPQIERAGVAASVQTEIVCA